MSHFKTKIGILGVGWVGGQLKRYFEEIKGYKAGEDLFLYDIDPKKCAGDINNADVIFVALPTPRNPKDGSCDTSILENAVHKIATHSLPDSENRSRNHHSENGSRNGKVIVIKSTVPPGTTEKLQQRYPQHKFLFNPEFLTESRAWEDMLRPDRQIVGFTKQSMDVAYDVLSLLPKAPFMSPGGLNTYAPTRITATEAEIIKYAGNVYFAHKVVWANALAKVAKKMGADYENIRKGMAADYRIGDSHLDVDHGNYRGFGGYCFPKDTSAFMMFAKEQGLNDVYNLIKASWDFNEQLLKDQGLTIDDVSKHISELEIEKLKKERKREMQ